MSRLTKNGRPDLPKIHDALQPHEEPEPKPSWAGLILTDKKVFLLSEPSHDLPDPQEA